MTDSGGILTLLECVQRRGGAHRMDDGEMIKIMKPEANGGGAPSVCYRPTELMMDLL